MKDFLLNEVEDDQEDEGVGFFVVFKNLKKIIWGF